MAETETTPTGQTDTQQEGVKEPITPALFEEPKEPPHPDGEGKEPDKPGEDSKPEGAAEEEAPLTKEDVTVPEGFTYDEELGKSFLDVVNDRGLSRKELLNRLVGMYAEQQGKMLEAMQAAETERGKQFEADMAAEKEAWMKQCQADSEFGGQGWEAAQAVIDRGCKQVATPGAVELLQRYNLHTHPEIVRMFYRAGKLAGEDRGAQGGSGQRPRALGEAIFEKSLEDWKKERGL
ncbi:MAG: hypothetical protein IJR68_03815 [Fretibacterium sp.]|nr:hypothetical protein [Fretibacterium sp.]